jgi:F0F1-type ATP synthase beta subunit
MANEKKNVTGYVIAVQGPVVDIKFDRTADVPDIHGLIRTKTMFF